MLLLWNERFECGRHSDGMCGCMRAPLLSPTPRFYTALSGKPSPILRAYSPEARRATTASRRRTRHDGRPQYADPRAAHKRWLQLWVPHLQRQWLARVLDHGDDDDDQAGPRRADDATATDLDEGHAVIAPTTERILRDYWAPRFRMPRINTRLADAMTRVFIPPVQCSTWRIPRTSDVASALHAARDSAPSPDGIPYTGWRQAGHDGHRVLARLTLDLAAQRRPPRCLLASVGVFLPKGSPIEDVPGSGARTRKAADTRPLAPKNTSSKTAAAVLNHPLRAAWMPPQQQGFLRGRGPIRHVLWLDTAARGATALASGTEWDAPDADDHDDASNRNRRHDAPQDDGDDDDRRPADDRRGDIAAAPTNPGRTHHSASAPGTGMAPTHYAHHLPTTHCTLATPATVLATPLSPHAHMPGRAALRSGALGPPGQWQAGAPPSATTTPPTTCSTSFVRRPTPNYHRPPSAHNPPTAPPSHDVRPDARTNDAADGAHWGRPARCGPSDAPPPPPPECRLARACLYRQRHRRTATAPGGARAPMPERDRR